MFRTQCIGISIFRTGCEIVYTYLFCKYFLTTYNIFLTNYLIIFTTILAFMNIKIETREKFFTIFTASLCKQLDGGCVTERVTPTYNVLYVFIFIIRTSCRRTFLNQVTPLRKIFGLLLAPWGFIFNHTKLKIIYIEKHGSSNRLFCVCNLYL